MTTVNFEPLAISVPIREDPPGVFRVGQSRVLHMTANNVGSEQ